MLVLAVLVLGLGSPAYAQSGVQTTPDGEQTLVSKDVGGERWAIARDADGTITGNVFYPDGRPPQFLWCSPSADAPPAQAEVAVSCFGTDACTLAPCVPDAWNFIADVSLPESFFAPPAGASRWIPLRPFDIGPRQEHPTLAFEDEIWVFGGFDDRIQTLDSVEVYDPATDRWRVDVAPLPRAMHHANVAAVNGRIYVAGYLIEGSFRPDGRVWELDPVANEWTERTSMPERRARGSSAVGVIDGKIYVAGGLAPATVAEFSSYDPSTDRWETLPDLPEPLDHAAAATVDGVLYVLGGRSGGIGGVSGSVYLFDPALGEWTQGADMPTPRGGVATAVVGRRIFVIGGEGNPDTESGVFDDVEAYDTEADTWEVFPPMDVPRHGMGAAAIGNRIYVPGGATTQAFGPVDTVDVLVVE